MTDESAEKKWAAGFITQHGFVGVFPIDHTIPLAPVVEGDPVNRDPPPPGGNVSRRTVPRPDDSLSIESPVVTGVTGVTGDDSRQTGVTGDGTVAKPGRDTSTPYTNR